jgi:hypothetical protein
VASQADGRPKCYGGVPVAGHEHVAIVRLYRSNPVKTLATNAGCFAGRITSLEGPREPDGGIKLSPEPPGQLIATDMGAIRSQSVGWVCYR